MTEGQPVTPDNLAKKTSRWEAVKNRLVRPHIADESLLSRTTAKLFPDKFRRGQEQQNTGLGSSSTGIEPKTEITAKKELPDSGDIFSRSPEDPAEVKTKLDEGVAQVISYISDSLKSPNSPLIDIKPSINPKELDTLFDEQAYREDLNAYLVTLEKEEIDGTEVSYIAIKLSTGKAIKPKLHKKGPEVVVPITRGIVCLGDVKKDEDGNYKRNRSNQKVIVDWEFQPTYAEPGKPFKIPPGKAHEFGANIQEAFYSIIGLPTNHLEEGKNGEKIDREWATQVSYTSTFI